VIKIPVPKPKSGENRDKFVSRCISTMKHLDPKRDDKQIQAICFDSWRKGGTKGERGGDRGGSHNRQLNNAIRYMMPFELKESASGKALIHGTAITASTSRNGVTYTVEGLKDNKSLIGMNVGIGHSGNPADNVGRIIKSTWDDVSKSIKYEAEIYNTARYPDAIDMVEKGLWQFVSIEAMPTKEPKINKESKELVVNDLEFLGLDFVKSPGIRQASAAIAGESFGVALSEALHIDENKFMEEFEMAEEKEEPSKEIPKEVEEKARLYDELMENKEKEKLKEELKKELLKELKEGIEKKKEEKVENVEEESKAVVTETPEEEVEETVKRIPVLGRVDGIKPGQVIVEGADTSAGFWVMPGKNGELMEAR